MLTKLFPEALLDREFAGRHRAERVLNAEVPYVRCLGSVDREDIRLHQPRCYNASAFGVRGYVCWKYALEAIIKVLLLYFFVHDNSLLFML